MSAGVTWNRPANRARAFAPSTSDCPARSPAPQLTHWFTKSGASAAHAIYENSHPLADGGGWDDTPGPPVGWAVFGGLDDVVPALYNADGAIAHWSQFEAGGHFPALEVPELLAGDLRAFFRELR